VEELDRKFKIHDFVCVAIDPRDSRHVYAGSWGSGLFEFYDDKVVNVYNGYNSTLQAPSGLEDYEVDVGGLCFDDEGTLWVTNSSAANVLSVLMADGETWKSFNLGQLAVGASNIEVGDIAIDHYGQKWILLRGAKMLVFTDNYTIDNTGDDDAKILTSSIGNGALPGSRVFSFAVDNEGEVWIGTDEGVAVFYTPENIFTNYDFDADEILVDYDGYTQPLLISETVTSITVDGANRKWFGTDRAGVFLLSEDGLEEVYHFTETNSSLLANSVSDIAINHTNGEVFFATSSGLISFKSTATAGGETNTNVYAYPNPVREDYDGVIAVKGLVTNADIKITDVSGTLIYETKAEGGQAIWDGRNFNGRKAATGVYLVFISNEDGSETIVTKILIIN